MPKSKQSPNARFLFQFRINQEEHEGFRAAAAKAQTDTSNWARQVLRREAGLWTGQRRTTDMTTTIDTITNKRIRALMTNAAEAGDLVQVAICRIALAQGLEGIADVDECRAELERLGIIPEHVDACDRARDLCARAITAAEAMES